MATVKIKFRPSTIDGEEGSIFYQIIHNRVVRRQKTGYRLYGYEWNSHLSEVVLPKCNEDRMYYLLEIGDKIRMDVGCFKKLIANFEQRGCDYTADDVIAEFVVCTPKNSLFSFMKCVIVNLKTLGALRTSETYLSALKSFTNFREGRDVLLDDIDSDLMMMYEAYLRNRGLTKNSTSFYMRILRAVYNRAVEKDLTANRNPFKHVYTGIDKTIKRAIPLKSIKQIKNLDLSLQPSLDFARDMFLFSFYTRGMSFIDMAYLKKKDLSNGILSYRRRKTGQQLFIRWEKCMQEIVEKYDNPLSEYLLPIIKPMNGDERTLYQNAMYLINRKLKEIGKMVGVQTPLTMYVARHSWASVAKNKNVPLSVISEGMGHDSEMTTLIYLASLDTEVVDKANKMILNLL